MTKLIFTWGLLGLMVFFAMSCVSKKKYVALAELYHKQIQQTDTLRQQLADQQNFIVATADSFQTMYTAILSQLDVTERSLQATSTELLERAQALRNIQDAIQFEIRALGILESVLDSVLKPVGMSYTFEQSQTSLHLIFSDTLFFAKASTELVANGKTILELIAPTFNAEHYELEINVFTGNLKIATARYRDNWDFAVLRATSITRFMMQNKQVTGPWLKASSNNLLELTGDSTQLENGKVVFVFKQRK